MSIGNQIRKIRSQNAKPKAKLRKKIIGHSFTPCWVKECKKPAYYSCRVGRTEIGCVCRDHWATIQERLGKAQK